MLKEKETVSDEFCWHLSKDQCFWRCQIWSLLFRPTDALERHWKKLQLEIGEGRKQKGGRPGDFDHRTLWLKCGLESIYCRAF